MQYIIIKYYKYKNFLKIFKLKIYPKNNMIKIIKNQGGF